MGVVAMIKTIKLEKLLFFVLMLVAVILAILFNASSKSSDNTSVFTGSRVKEPILIIDAGHGGADGGAVSLNGDTESAINLDIALRMSAIADLSGIKYTMTRESENIVYPDSLKSIAKKKVYDQQMRAALINKTQNAILLSVHQNIFTHASVNGPQAFYSKNEGSDALAKLIQSGMNGILCPGSRRVAAPIAQNIYLFKNVSCPAALAECGFISNPKESQLLGTDSYKLKISVVLMSAYMQYLSLDEQ
jgi:N-acetylmuramoyl-L-alanine amidase